MSHDSDWDEIRYDDHTPGHEMDRHMGQCHLCPVGVTKRITYCRVCRHWLCAECRHKWFERGIAAVREALAGGKDDCCGPIDDETVTRVKGERHG